MKQRIDPLLRRLSVDPPHYWLLLDLFHKLSSRQEMLQQNLVYNPAALWFVTFLYGLATAVVALIMINSGDVAEAGYRNVFLGITIFVMVMILMIEAGNTLVNPVEGVVLAHQPVSGSTYTAAKLTHLGRIVLHLGGGINLIPALAGYAIPETSLAYPLKHLTVMIAAGTAVALACCALFGYLLRFIPPARMKTAAQLVMGASFMLLQFGGSRIMLRLWGGIPPIPDWAKWALGAIAVAAVLAGVRSLSGDYLIRVNQLVQGGSRKRPSRKRQWGLGPWIAKMAGGPAALAGFSFVAKNTRRDWHYLRTIISFVPAVTLLAGILSRNTKSPFAGEFSLLLIVPHIVGMLLLSAAATLPFGAHSDATWLFRLAPSAAFLSFARGVRLWLMVVGVAVPSALLAVTFALWPWWDAALYIAFCAAVTSLYAAAGLHMIDGIPFGSQPSPERQSSIAAYYFVGLVLAAVMTAVEYLLFRSQAMVLAATAAAAAGALWMGRAGVRSFAIAMQNDLERSAERSLFREVN